MENKKGVLFLFVSLVFAVVLSFLVTGAHTLGSVPGNSNITFNYTQVGAITSNIDYIPEAYVANFTFLINNSGASEILNVSITLPTGFYVTDNATHTNYSNLSDTNFGAAPSNFTFYNLGSGNIVWAIGNESINGSNPSSEEEALMWNWTAGTVQQFDVELYTPYVSVDTIYDFVIFTTDNSTETASTTLTATVINQAGPSISEINVTDGYKTISTFDGSNYLQYGVTDQSNLIEAYNITFTLNHTLRINTTNISVALTNASNGGFDAGYILPRDAPATFHVINATTTDTNPPYLFTATINDSQLVNLSYFMSFAVIAKAVDQTGNESWDLVTGWYNFTLNDTRMTEGLSPASINITDGTNVLDISNAAGGPVSQSYLLADNAGNYTVNVEINSALVNTSNMTLIYNLTANTTPSHFGFDGGVSARDLTATDFSEIVNLTTSDSTPPYLFNGTILLNSSQTAGGRALSFVIMHNTDYYNESPIAGENETGAFNFTFDGDEPSSSIDTSSSTSLGLGGSITYNCIGTDGTSNPTCTMRLVRDGTEVEAFTEVNCGGNDKTYSAPNTNLAGTYTATCRVTDDVSKSAESTASFTVTAPASTGSSDTSPGSSTDITPSEVVSFDIDFTEVTKGTVDAEVGDTRTFTFEGSVTHSLTVDSIEGDTVTITISSESQTVSLKVGETIEVDYNDDGLNDISVTLNSITEGVASFTIEAIEGAEALAAEETAAVAEAAAAAEAATAEEDGGSNPTMIVIIVIVVLIILGLLFVFLRKK